jgi:thiosulfate dehydrogenase [quinone] large subunit
VPTVKNAVTAVIGEPAKRTNLRLWESLKNSRLAAVAWTAMRVWLGVMWIQAGAAKIWGTEAAGFMHNNGAGFAGFAAHGTPAYSWWGSFLHGFVVPNAGAIGVLVAPGELAIGIALVAGLFTRIAALASLALLFTYVMSGTASVCAFYALFAIVILVMADVQLDRDRRPDRRLPAAPPGPVHQPSAPARLPGRGRGRNRPPGCLNTGTRLSQPVRFPGRPHRRGPHPAGRAV